MRALFQVFLWMLPWTARRYMLRAVFGYDIAPSARIGFSIILTSKASLKSYSKVGHMTLVKGLAILELGEHASLGNLNWVTGMPANSATHFLKEADRDPSLYIEDHASITHRHLIDCTDRVTVGAFTTVAGWGTQILTHAIDLRECRQSSAPVRIGQHCFVGTRAIMLKGSSLPDRSVLAAGSVLGRTMNEPDSLYGGVPAALVKPVGDGAAYFTRTVGFVN